VIQLLHGPHRVAVRLVMILLAQRGWPASAIAELLGCGLGGQTLAEYRQLTRDAASRGLDARLGGEPLREIGCDLLALAREGLRARVDAGMEDRRVLDHLDLLDDVVASGRTFVQRALERWEGNLDRRPDRYVEAYQV
jgi:glutamate--cysteine ligase